MKIEIALFLTLPAALIMLAVGSIADIRWLAGIGGTIFALWLLAYVVAVILDDRP